MSDLEIVRMSECHSGEDVWVFIYIEYLYDIVLRGPFCGQGHISRVLVGFLRFVYLCLEPSMHKHKPVMDTLGWM